MRQVAVRAVFMRGGTSKALMFRAYETLRMRLQSLQTAY